MKEIHALDFVRKHKLPAPSSIAAAVERLIEKQIVYRTEVGYAIYDRLMGLWLS